MIKGLNQEFVCPNYIRYIDFKGEGSLYN